MNRRWVTVGALAAVCIAARGQDKAFPALAPYTACHLSGGLGVVAIAPLAPGVQSRVVETRHGNRTIALEAGERTMFAYPHEDFFANLKAELLPSVSYADERQALIDNFDHMLASGGSSRNYGMKPKLNGFEIYGLDRNTMDGGVLGIYLLFDPARRVALTFYFLNGEPGHRHFNTMGEYAGLRDQFLTAYTSCLAAEHPA